MLYDRMLEETDPLRMNTIAEDSVEEEKALNAFRSFYSVFSAERIRSNVRDVYGIDAYFRDGFNEVRGVENIERYFIKSIENAESCTFEIQDIASNKGNYYARWVMFLKFKKDPVPLYAVGMSHVRFDVKGKVVFHQDYWDTGLIYERIPLLGSVIRMIKKRIG